MHISTWASAAIALAGTSHALPAAAPGVLNLKRGLLDTIKDGFVDIVVEPVKDILDGDAKANKQATRVMDDAEISAFTNIAQFSRAAFCSAPVTLEWACGPACDANPETKVFLAGGDDAQIPGFYVAFDPPSNSMVVSHQGTNPDNIESLMNDLDFFKDDPLENRFPGAKEAGAQIHGGFQDTFEGTAQQVLDTVTSGIAETGATGVIVTGHSLGAAISLLDSLHLRKKLDPSININTVLFGLPRVGNPEFANYVEATLQGQPFNFFINEADPVPKLPPVEAGFRHPSGEIFQKKVGDAIETVECPGQENENCSTGISLFDADDSFHPGPYAGGVSIGGGGCKL